MRRRSPSKVLHAAGTSKPRGCLAAAMIALTIAAAWAPSARAEADSKIGLIGDSIMVATNSDDMCGSGGEIPKCIDKKFGRHDLTWSHGGGDQAWSMARRLGYGPTQTLNAADDGERWKDALEQAQSITADADVNAVFINMGSNDVCRDFGHDYSGDLVKIEDHIDDTLSHLLSNLAPGSRIYWSGVPNLVGFYDLMATRRHNYMFKSCQALWDLQSDDVTVPAAKSICKDLTDSFDGLCGSVTDRKWARDYIVDKLLDYYLDRYGVKEGPCGSVLDSANTTLERQAARDFNVALNSLLAQKAAEYDGLNGVEVHFTNVLFNTEIQPNYVSQLDCYHPSRAGQMKLSQTLWQAFSPGVEPNFAFWYDAFDDQDWCTQEYGASWATCWFDFGDPGFDIRVDDRGWLKLQKNTGRKHRRQIVRKLGDLSDMTQAWLSFNHKREKLDDGGDRVYFKVYKDGIWHRVDDFRGGGVDVGEHTGKYYDLRPFISSDVRIKFQTKNQRSMKDGDRVKFDNINLFAWNDGGVLDEPKALEVGRVGSTVTDEWQSVMTLADLPSPTAILAAMATANEEDPASVRLRNLDESGFEIKIEEEQSLDPETRHIGEIVAYAAFAPGLIIDSLGKVVGEAGVVTAKRGNGVGRRKVDLVGAYKNPVVIMNLTSSADNRPAHIRLHPPSGRTFQFAIEGWNDLGQSHKRESVAYIVVESGIHELVGGAKLEAGTAAADHRWKAVQFAADFDSTPVALSQCQTRRGGEAVVTRQRDVSRTGFQMRLQEEESSPGFHTTETLGYVAIEP